MADKVRFEWDFRKAETNWRKHAISFAAATQVFHDRFVEKKPQGDEHGEIRWTAIGQVGSALLHVTYTTRETEDGEVEVFRIVSARRATRGERRHYEGDS